TERARLSNHVFDATKWPLFQITTARLTEKKSYIFFCFDHLICDAASIMILVKEWGMLLDEPKIQFPTLTYTYKDYILDFQKSKHSEKFEQSMRYWLDKLEEFPLAPSLPFRCQPNDVKKPKFRRQRKLFSQLQWSTLKGIVRQNDCTPAALLCTA